jgi:alpha-beta hydrolase superfamily lysophospholipase
MRANRRHLLPFPVLLVFIAPRALVASDSAHGLTPAMVAEPPPAAVDPAEAAVLVGGINDTWRSLDGWALRHAAAGRRVLGYTYDQSRDDLDTSARFFAEALLSLCDEGVRRLHIAAYSMGGWVAKAALDRMAVEGSLARFDSIEFTAIATPWGGFGRANVAWRLRHFPTSRLARAFSRVIGKPMAFEVGSRTAFVRLRRAPLPPIVTFRVFEGGNDETATPRNPEERENYEAVVSLACARVLVAGARHADMRHVSAQVSETRASGSCLDWRSR